MEQEERLSLETQKCQEIIKARVSPLQEMVDKLKQSESTLKDKLRKET